jgi:hypothetical protein
LNPIPHTLKDLELDAIKEYERLFTQDEQELRFKPYREEISKVLNEYADEIIDASAVQEFIDNIDNVIYQKIEYKCDSCSENITENFHIPIHWLIDDEYTIKLRHLFLETYKLQYGYNPSTLIDKFEYTNYIIEAVDQFFNDQNEKAEMIFRLIEVWRYMPKEINVSSDKHRIRFSIVLRLFKLFLEDVITYGITKARQNLSTDQTFQLNLLLSPYKGKIKVDSHLADSILKDLNDFVDE